jgi:hypothetical protein
MVNFYPKGVKIKARTEVFEMTIVRYCRTGHSQTRRVELSVVFGLIIL